MSSPRCCSFTPATASSALGMRRPRRLVGRQRPRTKRGSLDELIVAYPAIAGALLPRPPGRPPMRSACPRLGSGELDAPRDPRPRRGGLADPLPRGTEAQINAEMGLIDGMLAPLAGLARFFRRQIAPPREVLRARSAGRRQRSPLRDWATASASCAATGWRSAASGQPSALAVAPTQRRRTF